MKKRTAEVRRKTKETDISVKVNLDGNGKASIKTPIGLLNHMLELFAFHGKFDLQINATGDFKKIDPHHTNEDIGIVLGDAFNKALADKKGIRRSGDSVWPMEDVVATVAVDISGRGFFKEIVFIYDDPSTKPEDSGYSFAYANHFFESFAKKMGINLSIKLETKNPDLHTNLEPVFKALGKSLEEATRIDPRRIGIPSTKGIID